MQRFHQFGDLTAILIAQTRVLQCVLQLIEEFGGDPREIIDEVKRILDLMRDAGGELTERGELLCLDQPILCGPQSSSDFANSRVRA